MHLNGVAFILQFAFRVFKKGGLTYDMHMHQYRCVSNKEGGVETLIILDSANKNL